MASASLDLNDPNGQLPRIAVISDVAVERTGAGSLLLYRLLKDYPSDQLKIFYNPDQASSGDVRLPAAQYYPLRYRFSKAIRNRFNPFWPIAGAYQMQQRAADVLRCLGTFKPEAVVSVAHGFLWFTADAVARKLGVPLHLFLHEDWPQLVTQNQPGRVKDLVRAVARMRIKRIFRGPGARFSVSPGMAEELLERYGLKTEVVYPNRGDDSPTAVVRVAAQASRAPTVAHAGFIHFPREMQHSFALWQGYSDRWAVTWTFTRLMRRQTLPGLDCFHRSFVELASSRRRNSLNAPGPLRTPYF